MSRFLLLFSLLLFPSQSFSDTLYTVNIAVYKDATTLNQRLNKLSPKLRDTIKVIKKNGQYRANTFPTTDIKVLEKLLPRYKKEFTDAHIAVIPKTNSSNGLYKER